MKPCFVVLLSALTVIMLGSPSLADSVPLGYGKSVFSVPSENVVAFWGLEDLPTYNFGLKSTAHLYRNPLSLPSPSVVRGTAVGYSGGHVQFRQNDLNAVTSDAISATGGGSLLFPLAAVGGSSFTFHFWVKFDADSAAGAPVEPFLSVIGSDLQVTTEELIGGGSPLTIAGFSFGSSWKFVALSVQVSSPSSSVWTLSVFDGTSTVSVSATRPAWTGSSISLQGNSFGSTTFDNVALVAGSVSGPHLDALVVAGYLGACLSEPCFSGVHCTSLSSSRFQCGPCPSQYHGDGMDCEQSASHFPVEYRACVPHGAQLSDPTFCAASCTHRWTCMACTNNYDVTPQLANQARGHCDTVFASERSASPTPSNTASPSLTPSASPTVSVSASSSPLPPACAQVVMRNDLSGSTITLPYNDCYYDVCFTTFNDATQSFTVTQLPGGPTNVVVTLYEHYSPAHGATGSFTSYSGYGYHLISPYYFGVSSATIQCSSDTSLTWNGASDFDVSDSTFSTVVNVNSLHFTSSGNYGHAHGGTVSFYVSLLSNGNWVQVGSYSTSGTFYFNSSITMTFSDLSNVTGLRMNSSPYQGQSFHGWSGATFTLSG